MYNCNNNIDNPLFDCSASDNSYYGWNGDELEHFSFPILMYFTSKFSSMNVLVTFLINNVSAPASLRYTALLNNQTQFSSPVINVPDNLPEGSSQHNYTLTSDVMFNGVIIIVTPNTTFQWVAINRIIFCPAVEG